MQDSPEPLAGTYSNVLVPQQTNATNMVSPRHAFPGSSPSPTATNSPKLLPEHRIRDHRGMIPRKEATSGAWGFQPQN